MGDDFAELVSDRFSSKSSPEPRLGLGSDASEPFDETEALSFHGGCELHFPRGDILP